MKKNLLQVSFLTILSMFFVACQPLNVLPVDGNSTGTPPVTSLASEASSPEYISRIVSSSDGNQWQVVYETTWLDLANIYCVDNLTCYALSENESILRSTDGGLNWDKLGAKDMVVHSDSPFGCVQGGFCLLVESTIGGKVWATQDGGATWHRTGDSPVSTPESMACSTSGSCILISRLGEVYSTHDAGGTWQRGLASSGITYKNIACVSESTCYIVGMVFAGEYGVVVKTVDGGKTWELAGDSKVRGLRSISCPTQEDCMSVGRFGIQISHDAGNSWTALPGLENGARSVSCSSAQNCIIIDSNGQVYSWNGMALSKKEVEGEFSLRGVSCTTDESCYVAGAFTRE